MQTKLLSIFTATLLLFGSQQVMGQAKFPPASSSTKIEQGLGINKVTLTYQRPNVNNRTIFGDREPYNEVWRTGANLIPSITFEEEVTIEGNKVPAGTYGIFTIPTKTNWTIIFSKNPNQWGAYDYKQEEDLLRFQVKSKKTKEKVESFTMAFENVTPTGTDLSLAWENTKVQFHIAVDQHNEILASINESMKGEKKPYFQAAQYYYNNGLDINQAVEWISEADKTNTDAPYIKYWKAVMQLKAGDKSGATKTANEGIEMAKSLNNEEYVRLNTQVLKSIK